MDSFAAMDFFSVEVWTPRGLITYYVLFVIELKTRRVEVAGITPNPDGNFMRQIARNLTDPGRRLPQGQAIRHPRPRRQVH